MLALGYVPDGVCVCGLLVVELRDGQVLHVGDRCRWCPPAGVCPDAALHGAGRCEQARHVLCAHGGCPVDAPPGPPSTSCARGADECCGCCNPD